MNLEEFKAELVRRFPWEPRMNHMAIDANGDCYQYANQIITFAAHWGNSFGATKYVGSIELPGEIDWRDTLISRAETEQPAPPAPPTFEQRHDALMAKLDELIGVLRAVVEAVQPTQVEQSDGQAGSSPAQESPALAEFKADLLRYYPWGPNMNYMAVDRGGYVFQYEFGPIMSISYWHNSSGIAKAKGRIGIPDGIDWRDTLIARAKNATDEQQ